MLLILVEVSGLSVQDSHRLKTQSYLHATCPGGSICECPQQPQTEDAELSPCYLFSWKYMCKWLVRHRATYSGESICESGLSVHIVTDCSHSHHHATYCGGSACESGLSVHDSHRLKAQSYPHATYCGGSIWLVGPGRYLVFVKVACWSTDCSTKVATYLVEVSVNVVCRFTQSQTAAIEPLPCNLLWWKYL